MYPGPRLATPLFFIHFNQCVHILNFPSLDQYNVQLLCIISMPKPFPSQQVWRPPWSTIVLHPVLIALSVVWDTAHLVPIYRPFISNHISLLLYY